MDSDWQYCEKVFKKLSTIIKYALEGVVNEVEEIYEDDIIRLYCKIDELHPYGGQNALVVDLNVREYGGDDYDISETELSDIFKKLPSSFIFSPYLGVHANGEYILPEGLEWVKHVERLALPVAIDELHLPRVLGRLELIHRLLSETFEETNILVHQDQTFDQIKDRIDGYVILNGMACEFQEYHKQQKASADKQETEELRSTCIKLSPELSGLIDSYTEGSERVFRTLCNEAITCAIQNTGKVDVPEEAIESTMTRYVWVDTELLQSLMRHSMEIEQSPWDMLYVALIECIEDKNVKQK